VAGFWTRDRVVAYAAILAVGYLLMVALLNLMADRQARDGLAVLATDYVGFHSGALALKQGPPESVFDTARLTEAQHRALESRYGGDLTPEQRDAVRLFYWRYPPPIFFLVRPLAELPAQLGYYLWGFALLAPLVLAGGRIVPGAAGLVLTLAMPATFLNFMYGQNGALTAGLIGLGLTLSQRRPVLAGVAVGLLCYKPQFAALFPLVFLISGNWRAFAAAALTVAAVVGLSVTMFGVAPWLAFLDSLSRTSGHLEEGNVAWTVMPTTFAGLRMWLPAGAAHAGQAVVSVAAVATVAWLWLRGRTRADGQAGRYAAVCLATLLIQPFAFLYDLAILTPALLWLGRDLVERGGRPAEWLMLSAAALLPFYAGVVAKLTNFQIGPAVVAGCLILAVRRTY
jgi:hypothetical protein